MISMCTWLEFVTMNFERGEGADVRRLRDSARMAIARLVAAHPTLLGSSIMDARDLESLRALARMLPAVPFMAVKRAVRDYTPTDNGAVILVQAEHQGPNLLDRTEIVPPDESLAAEVHSQSVDPIVPSVQSEDPTHQDARASAASRTAGNTIASAAPTVPFMDLSDLQFD
eukprot:m.295742 g.295742  ORF g.295742 m.295742 type:complete len:171 (+) comp55156_c0_seq14:1033-1545(+)